MPQITKYALLPVLLIIMAVAGVVAAIPASAQSSSGQFNPQTQFTIGTKLQITSIYGLETSPPPISAMSVGGRYYGQNGNHNQTIRTGPVNQQWNLTYLRNTPTANSSITITAQVTNDTQDGGVLWTVQGGSIAYNGTTLTVTSGKGGIGKLNRVLMVGNATDSNGNTFRWNLEGLATLYSGSVIVSLTGNVAELNQNTPAAAPTQPYRGLTLSRVLSLTYIATIS
jgi:hypothetical protein